MSTTLGKRRVVVLGGTGFVGRTLAENWPADAVSPIFLVHRSRPAWLDVTAAEVRSVDLNDVEGVRRAIAGYDVLINLLRPDGTGWYPDLLTRLQPAFAASGMRRCVHASSIDIYSGVTIPYVDEDTPPRPLNSYETEHLMAETIFGAAFPEAIILRLGAVFGPGGRNIVAFAEEMRRAPAWKLVLRRILYGDRRMHLVSVETVALALSRIALEPSPLASQVILLTEDGDPRNTFGFVQDSLAKAFSRRTLSAVPALPKIGLQFLMRVRGMPSGSVGRRFSSERARRFGIEHAAFATRLEDYARHLAASE